MTEERLQLFNNTGNKITFGINKISVDYMTIKPLKYTSALRNNGQLPHCHVSSYLQRNL